MNADIRVQHFKDPADIYDCPMQFILGVILFVIVIGAVDAGVPWPRCGAKETKQ